MRRLLPLFEPTRALRFVLLPLVGKHRASQRLNPAINSDFMVEGEVVRFASYDGLQVQASLSRREASLIILRPL